MKRGMVGGAYRGPVAHSRQRRTIRFMQFLFLGIAVALAVLAVTSASSVGGAEDPSSGRGAPVSQPVALGIMALVATGAAVALGGRDGVRIPTPARLDELAGRAEGAAVERAERFAGEAPLSPEAAPGAGGSETQGSPDPGQREK